MYMLLASARRESRSLILPFQVVHLYMKQRYNIRMFSDAKLVLHSTEGFSPVNGLPTVMAFHNLASNTNTNIYSSTQTVEHECARN